MKLGQYIEHLQAVEHTHGSDLLVVYAIDEEGNAFHPVHYAPSAGQFDEKDNAFWQLQPDAKEKINSVCIN